MGSIASTIWKAGQAERVVRVFVCLCASVVKERVFLLFAKTEREREGEGEGEREETGLKQESITKAKANGKLNDHQINR